MKKTLKWSIVMMLAVVGMTFTSCDDDDTPAVPTVEEVNGNYSGTMKYLEADAKELDLKVANDSVIFEAFPYQPLVEAVVGKEAAAGIIALIGDSLAYKVNYIAAMNAANDSVIITLKPEPLNIPLGENAAVVVTITADKKASYAIDKKNFKFDLTATEAKLGEANALQNPIDLAFDMNKK